MKTLEEKIREKFPRHMSFVECIRETSDVDLAKIMLSHDKEIGMATIDLDIQISLLRKKLDESYIYNWPEKARNYNALGIINYHERDRNDFDQSIGGNLWNNQIIPSYFGIASRFAFRVYFKDINFDPIVVLKSYEIGNSLFNNIRMISFTKS